MEGQALIWPYGFRFEWKLKRAFRQSTGSTKDEDELTTKIRPHAPSGEDILRHIPDQVVDQLQSTVLSLSDFQESLQPLQVSVETKRIVLQRVLADMAGNERETLLGASSWWRQHALDHGSGYVDAVISHYLYKCMTDDIFSASQYSRHNPLLKSEAEELNQRREAILATAPEHIVGHFYDDEASAAEAYLARAEIIRELIIFANNKICTTIPTKRDEKDTSMDTVIGDIVTPFNDNAGWKTMQLEKCKRVASIVQLHDLCEQNNWSLVACHVETKEVSSGRKLFRRLLSVVSKLEEDPTRAKALIRPAIEPFPMQSLAEHCSSEGGRSILGWDRSSPEGRQPAKQFYPLIVEHEDLVTAFGRHSKDMNDVLVRPENMARVLRRKVDLFDYFDDENDRAANPFSHFRHAVDELMHIFRTDVRTTVRRYYEQTQSVAGTPSSSQLDRTVPQGSQKGLETPKRLLVHPYNGSPWKTPSSVQSSPSSNALALTHTPTRRTSIITTDDETQIENLQSDLAILFRTLLTARGIDAMSDRETITSSLVASATFSKPIINRLLSNPAFQDRYGALGEPIHDSPPNSQEAATFLTKRLQEDTADVFHAILESRGIDLAAKATKIVAQLDSKLISGEVVERVLANSLVKARRRRKRKADEEREQAIKEEMMAEQEQRKGREREKRKRVASG